jgi:hypothetical protein
MVEQWERDQTCICEEIPGRKDYSPVRLIISLPTATTRSLVDTPETPFWANLKFRRFGGAVVLRTVLLVLRSVAMKTVEGKT